MLRAIIVLVLVVAACSMTTSKLSIHTGMGDNSWNVINGGKPRLVKLLDSFGDAAKIKSAVPGIVIIGRIYQADQPNTGDAGAAAQNWWNSVKATILAYPAVDYWEGYNEPDASKMQWMSDFEVARVSILADNNLKACIGSFGVGTPDETNPSAIEAYYPAIDQAIKHEGILGLHEYGGPYLNSSFSGSVATGSGWFTGRYRKLVDQFLAPTNRTIKIAITENGMDTIPGSPVNGGWKNHCTWWQQQGNGNDCPATYMEQLAWYDKVMQANDYVIGSTIFSLEISGWDQYDIAPMVPNLIQHLQEAQSED